MKIKNNMHDNAAGYSIPVDKLGELHSKANNDLSCYDFGDSYYEVNFRRKANDQDISDLIEDLHSYKDVWGQGNSEALINITDLYFSMKDVLFMGKNGDTLKIVKNGIAYIKFFAKDLIEKIKSMNTDKFKLEIVGKANMNYWAGRSMPQIFIESYELKEDNLLDF